MISCPGDTGPSARVGGYTEHHQTSQSSHLYLGVKSEMKEDKMGDMRKPVFGVCEQHRPRPACASAQTDQPLCYSLFGKYHI